MSNFLFALGVQFYDFFQKISAYGINVKQVKTASWSRCTERGLILCMEQTFVKGKHQYFVLLPTYILLLGAVTFRNLVQILGKSQGNINLSMHVLTLRWFIASMVTVHPNCPSAIHEQYCRYDIIQTFWFCTLYIFFQFQLSSFILGLVVCQEWVIGV